MDRSDMRLRVLVVEDCRDTAETLRYLMAVLPGLVSGVWVAARPLAVRDDCRDGLRGGVVSDGSAARRGRGACGDERLARCSRIRDRLLDDLGRARINAIRTPVQLPGSKSAKLRAPGGGSVGILSFSFLTQLPFRGAF